MNMSTLAKIRRETDLVRLVRRTVKLKRAGDKWKGLCPFHREKIPSFMVSPKHRVFHCFGCGVGGDVFAFLMRQQSLSFPEAVQKLAKRAKIAL